MATILFTGRFEPSGFADFAAHRALRLDLAAYLETAGPDAVTITVAGEPDLIDAFEMACSLGPADCLVHAVERRPARPRAAEAGR